MNTAPVAVAAYARASSDEQKNSVGDQLKALRAEAARRGYVIVAEYTDDGLSGSKNIAKRVAFARMIEDSAKREFTRILVYDLSRFGRLDSQTGAAHKLTLRKNGVEGIISLGEGEINWATGMGRMMDSMLSEANHETALKISTSSIRGRMEQLIERKIYPHGQIPFGYAKLYRGDGQEVRLARIAKFTKPKSWKRELVVEETEAATVRRVYDLYVNHAQSIRQITALLNREGVPGWDKDGWSWNSVSKIITGKCYLGYGMIHSNKKVVKEAHHRMPHTEVPGILPVIIDQGTWEIAQRLHSKATVSKFRSDKDNRTLSGMIRCGHCGYALVSKQRTKRKGKAGSVFYSCIGGLKYSSGCPQYQAYEHDVLPSVIKELVKTVDAEVLAALAPTTEESGKDDISEAQRKVVERLREQVKRATLRAATADDDMLAEYDQAARDLKQQLKQAEDKLRVAAHVEQAGGPAIWAEWWAEVRPGLVLASDDPELAAELTEATKTLPALALVQGNGGFQEYWTAARKALVRLSADGETDPLATIIPFLAVGETHGSVLVSRDALKGVLRRLGCEVSLWWREVEQVRRNEAKWVLDKAKISISWVGHPAPTSRGSGLSGVPETPRTITLVVRF